MDDPRYLVDVKVTPTYQGEKGGKFAFSYAVEITNTGSFIVQLKRRRWLITNGNGETQEVEGEGVIGEQPVLVPGDTFKYESGAVIETQVGSMRGEYAMQAVDGHSFMARIPTFTLAVPGILN